MGFFRHFCIKCLKSRKKIEFSKIRFLTIFCIPLGYLNPKNWVSWAKTGGLDRKNVFFENLILGQIPIQNHEKRTKLTRANEHISTTVLSWNKNEPILKTRDVGLLHII